MSGVNLADVARQRKPGRGSWPRRAASGLIGVQVAQLGKSTPHLKKVSPDARTTTVIKEVICPLDRVSTASPTDRVTNLLGLSEGCSEGRTLVLDGGRGVGIISPSDINRLLQTSLSGRAQARSRRA